MIRFEEVILHMEQNPVGVWLLQLDKGNVWPFIYFKLAGTVVVCSVLLAMWRFRYRHLFPVTASLTWWQIGLLLYLTHA